MPVGVGLTEMELATVLGLIEFAWKSGAVKSPQAALEFAALQQNIEVELKERAGKK